MKITVVKIINLWQSEFFPFISSNNLNPCYMRYFSFQQFPFLLCLIVISLNILPTSLRKNSTFIFT